MPRVIYLGFSGLAGANPPLLAPEALAQEASGDVLLPGAPSPIDSEALSDWLAQPERPRALLAWPQPQAFLADALAQETDPERALEQWIAIAEQVLGLFRRYRRQVVLLGLAPGERLSPAAALPEAWRDAAGRAEAAVQPLPQPGALHRLAAAQLTGAEALQEVLAYLQASSHAASASAAGAMDTVKAALAHQAHQEAAHKQADRECRALAQERDALTSERDALASEHAGLVQAQSRLEQELHDAKGGRAAAEEENGLLIGQLHKVQETLEEALQRQQRDADQLAELTEASETSAKALEHERKRHKAAAQALKNAEKALSQLRREAEETNQKEVAARRNAEQLEAQAEHELLMRQMHQVQEALEKALHDQQQKEDQCREAEQRCNALAQERDAAEEENTLVIEQLHKVQEALEEALHRQQHDAEQMAELERKNAGLTQEARKLENQLQQAARQKSEAQQEIKLLVAQLHHAQETLEAQEAANQRLSAQGREEQHRHQQRLHELNCLIGWLRAHAYRHAAVAYRDSRRYRKALPAQCALVAQSELFDADWYRQRYPDVAQADISPVEHYVKFGALEGRDPGPRFSTEFYLIEHPDVAESGQHPLLHYLKDGIHEQRRTTPEAAA